MASILYKNKLRDTANYTVLTDDTIANYGIANAYDGRTNTQAGFTGTDQEIVLDFAAAETIDAIGLARHNLGTDSGTLTLESSTDNVSYTVRATISPSDDKVTLTEFASVSARYWKIKVTAGSTVYIADIFLSEKLALERSQRFGFLKPEYSDNDKVTPNVTRGNNIVGIDVQQKPKRVVFNLFYYSAAWFSVWSELVSEVKLHPVYILWADSEQAFYCWPNGAIPKPVYSAQVTNRYTVALDMQGFIE